MKDYNRKSREYLLITFMLGGLFGILDIALDIAYFLGSGIAMMFLTLGVGYLFHMLMRVFGIYEEPVEDDGILDAEEELEREEEKLKHKLRPFKYAMYAALIFFLNELGTFLFYRF